MARADTYTLLSLDTWARIMGISPWEFNQFTDPIPNRTNACQQTFFQYEWQRDYLSREEIARAIAQAEQLIADELNYWPAPLYITNETLNAARTPLDYYTDPLLWRPWGILYGGWHYWRVNRALFQTKYHKVQGGGTLARTLIGAANVAYSDTDGDGINDTATITIAVSTTDTNEIAAYFNATDRMNNPLLETWRIRPVRVTISGGTATIVGSATLFVKPTFTYGVDVEPLTATDSTVYVTSVDVYRVYTDTTQTGTAYWQPPGGDCYDEPCAIEAESISCLLDRNGQAGQVGVGFSADRCLNWRQPDSINISYLAGVPLVNGDMDTQYAQVVAKLASGLLPNLSCGCERSDRIVSYWRQDVTEPGPDYTPRQLSPLELESRFGFTRGALFAWKWVNNLKHASIGGAAL